MNENKKVSQVVVRRLSRYYRYLTDLLNGGIERISSKALSERMNSTASQIRQDLNCFGGFGQQGYGYKVSELHGAIGEILGLDRGYRTIIIGAGNLGRAIANYHSFENRGFKNIAIFENNPELIGQKVNGVSILSIDELKRFMETEKPEIGVLTLPKENANEVAQKLVDYGIKGIWNFSHMELSFQSERSVPVENVHLSDSLMTLSYRITALEEDK